MKKILALALLSTTVFVISCKKEAETAPEKSKVQVSDTNKLKPINGDDTGEWD